MIPFWRMCCVNVGNLHLSLSHFLRADYLTLWGRGRRWKYMENQAVHPGGDEGVWLHSPSSSQEEEEEDGVGRTWYVVGTKMGRWAGSDFMSFLVFHGLTLVPHSFSSNLKANVTFSSLFSPLCSPSTVQKWIHVLSVLRILSLP